MDDACALADVEPRGVVIRRGSALSVISYPEAAVIGLLQGVTELFPVSSLGHSVLLPALIGGSWARDLQVNSPESPYLAFIVGLHVATAIALIIFFWKDWVRIVGGLLTSVRDRRVETPDQRLGWLLVLATIPVGVTGLLLEHTFRTILSKPIPTSIFLALNGLILLGGEQLRQRHIAASSSRPNGAGPARQGGGGTTVSETTLSETSPVESDRTIARLPVGRAVLIGCAQILALAPGISRSGATMTAGLLKGLSHEDAARFSFLLATPVILAAGVLKLPDLFGPLGAGIHGQVLVGSVLSGLAAYASVRFLTRYFENRSLRPFGVYCLVAGLGCLVWFVAS
ncbi:MAG: undecaprenyl-diphosphatase [Frankiaceae bacterium]|nr:undecaprenyl-diphosphatase [Frankiaceae bacterium]